MFDEKTRRELTVEFRSAVTSDALGVGAFFLVYAFLLREIRIGQMYAFGDLSPYYGARAMGKFASVWHHDQLGFSHIFNAIPAYLGALTTVGGEVVQNLFYLALIPVGFLAFFVFAGRFVDGVPRVLAASVYALNPITIHEFVNGGMGALIAFAGIPLVLHYLYEATERETWFPALMAGAAFGAVAVIPYLAFWMVFPFAAFLLYRARTEPRVVAKLSFAGVLGVLLSLPSAHYLFQRGSALDSPDVLFNHVSWNYAAADPLTVLRLAGNRGAWGMNQLGYNSEPTMAVGLLVPAVALLAWRRERLRYLFLVVGGLALFMVLTKHRVTYPLFEAFPPLFSIRNPVKLQYPLLLSTSLLFGAGVEELFDGVGFERRDLVLRLFLVAVLVIPLFSYVAPASGALGLGETRGDEYYVPEDYDRIGDSVDGTVLWAPYSYTTQLRLRHAYPDHVGIRSEGLVQGTENAEYVAELYRDFAAGDPVASRLNDLGVRYVVVDSSPQRRYAAAEGEPRLEIRHEAPWLFGDPQAFEERLAGSPAYTEAFSTDRFTVYRVEGTPDRDRAVQRTGLHAVVTPEEPSVETVGQNRLSNPAFDAGIDGWWTPPNASGRNTRLTNPDGERAVVMEVDDSVKRLPLAQSTSLRKGHPYRVSIDAEGDGVVNVLQFDGDTSPDNRVAKRTVPLDELPTRVTAEGDTLAIRVVPNASSEILVRGASLYRTTYPPETGVTAGDRVPGVTVDGREERPANATVVAVNTDRETARRASADVRILDAETMVGGSLVFDETYRQGVGVRLDREDRPDAVPADARAVTDETSDGRVVDYWVLGEFDDRPVTVLYTSYDERWTAGSGAEHFEAYGWANGFTDAGPEDVRWTGDGVRRTVVVLWLAFWVLTLGALIGLWAVRRTGNPRNRQSASRL